MWLLHYWYRRLFGWLPVQFCMVCGKPYWGGWPRFHLDAETIMQPGSKWVGWPRSGKRWTCVWQAYWMDYCSKECSDRDLEDLS